jgi:hypothetical protein
MNDLWVRFDVTPADWEAFAEFQLRHSPTLQRTTAQSRIIITVGMALATALIWWVTKSAFVLVVGVVAGVWSFFDTPRVIRKSVKKQMHAMFAETFRDGSEKGNVLEIRDDGLYSDTPRGKGTLAWSALVVYDESPTHVYLGLGGPSGIVIPKQRIESGDIAAFSAALRQRMAAAAPSY